jgi:hypothetical protein
MEQTRNGPVPRDGKAPCKAAGKRARETHGCKRAKEERAKGEGQELAGDVC